MTFQEAVRTYAQAASRDSVRDRAIIRSINHEMGVLSCGLLLGHGVVLEACGESDEASTAGMAALRDLFVCAVENSTIPTPLPAGVREYAHGHRLHAEVRDDGHTYIGDERID